jgi:hypothetical protein
MVAPYVRVYSSKERNGFERITRFIKVPHKRPLEPQAGNGAILERLRYYNLSDCAVCEIDPDFRAILHSKSYQVVGINHLNHTDPLGYDFIIANPPFLTGVDHLLHSWELLQPGGRLIYLLNAESVKTPTTAKERQLDQLIDLFGDSCPQELGELEEGDPVDVSVEYLGSCFSDCERPTDVEVVCVRLHKPETDTADPLGTEGMKLEAELSEPTVGASTALVSASAIEGLVGQYLAAKEILIERYARQKELDQILEGIATVSFVSRLNQSNDTLSIKGDLDLQIRVLKARFWSHLFILTRVEKRLTSKFAAKFEDLNGEYLAIEFSTDNVKEMLNRLWEKADGMMRESITDVFDHITSKHKDNITGGWKTNLGHKINKKMVWPDGVFHDDRKFSIYGRSDYLRDLDAITTYLSGTDPEDPTFLSAMDAMYKHLNSTEGEYSDKFVSTFFEFRIYKKGTVHIWWRDEALLHKFNTIAAKYKNWLPQTESNFV